METLTKTDQEVITTELANAIASFDRARVADLLSEKAEYCIQND